MSSAGYILFTGYNILNGNVINVIGQIL